MSVDSMPTGAFTCVVTLRLIRPPKFVREEKGGVTYMVARDYELAYETILRFTNGAQLPVTATLVGELNQRVVIRDAHGRPAQMSGYVQGRAEISGAQGHLIFRGRYYDSRTLQCLTGDEALTVTGPRVTDHLENGFGEGPYAGHAFSLGGQLTREGEELLHGECRGQID
jgi:hypothetical protein